MPMTGGINCPPSEEAVSMAAAVTRGMPAPIMAGMVAEPTVMALAAPLPLTVPTAIEPSTADCGSACGERRNAARPVEDGVLGVDVEVNEGRFGHEEVDSRNPG